jgi:hypothetical protein
VSHSSANRQVGVNHRRLALGMLLVYLAVAAAVFVVAKSAPGQHWTARALGSLVAADGLSAIGLAAYLRFVRRRPRRNEGLFLAVMLMTAAVGWYSVRAALALPIVAGATLGITVVRRWLKPRLFDAWWADAGISDNLRAA